MTIGIHLNCSLGIGYTEKERKKKFEGGGGGDTSRKATNGKQTWQTTTLFPFLFG